MDPSRHRVGAVTDGIEVGLAVDGEVRALGDLRRRRPLRAFFEGRSKRWCGSAKKISIEGFTDSSA